MARKTYFKGRNIRFMQGGGGHVAYLQNGPSIDVVDGDDGERRHMYRGYDMISQIPAVDILDTDPDKIDALTLEDLYDAYYSLYPEMKGYEPLPRGRRQKFDPRKIDKHIYELGFLKDIEEKLKSKQVYDNGKVSYVTPMSWAIRRGLETAGYAPDEYKNRRKEVVKWIERALGY